MQPQWQQEQLRRQQEFMRQQQESLRRQQMHAAWADMQKKKTAQQAQAQKAMHDLLPDHLAKVAVEAAALRQRYLDGQVTQEELSSKMQELMAQDGQGKWWTVDLVSGEWRRYDDGQWVSATPPLRPGPSVVYESVPKPRRFLGVVVFLFSLALTFGAGLLAGSVVSNAVHDEIQPWLAAGAVWLVGFILTVRWARKVSRG